MFRLYRKLSAAIAIALSGLPMAVFAGGPAFTGNAAEADSAETAASNPAGMARLGESAATVQMMAGKGIGKFEVDESRTTTTGGDPDNDNSPVVIPFGYYVRQLDDRWHVGISLTVPNGFGADYGSDWAGRYYSDSYSLVYVMLAPAVSYRVDDHWSLGASLGINYVASESETAVRNLEPGRGDGRLKAEVDGVGFSVTLSALYEVDKQTRFGVVYTSQSVTDLEGDLKFRDLGPIAESALRQAGKLDSDIEITNRLPQRIVAGVYHQMDSGNYYTADVAWMEFSKFGTTNIAWDGTDLRYDDDGTYNNIWALMLGAGFPVGQYTWKAGVFYLSSPVDDDKRTLAMPLDRVIGVGGGVSFPVEGTSSVDLNFNIIDLGKAPVDTGASVTRGRVVGETDNPYVFLFDASYHF
jgi:long-chain fatty acid transport protein